MLAVVWLPGNFSPVTGPVVWTTEARHDPLAWNTQQDSIWLGFCWWNYTSPTQSSTAHNYRSQCEKPFSSNKSSREMYRLLSVKQERSRTACCEVTVRAEVRSECCPIKLRKYKGNGGLCITQPLTCFGNPTGLMSIGSPRVVSGPRTFINLTRDQFTSTTRGSFPVHRKF